MITWKYKKFDELLPEELYAILQLRNEVFVVEQNCVFQDADNKDLYCYHLMLYEQKELVGYARLVPTGLSYEEILREVESIVSSGTKLNLGYYVDEVIDEDRQDEVFEYFRSAEVDSVDQALKELGDDDYTMEELQLMRIKFLSELGN